MQMRYPESDGAAYAWGSLHSVNPGGELVPNRAQRRIRDKPISWPRTNAASWTLSELLGLVVAAAGSARLASTGSPCLGLALLVFIVFTRVAITDFTHLGSLATALVMGSGIAIIFLGVHWLLH
jgi:hypothetical protein